jgi:hypothetical protein
LAGCTITKIKKKGAPKSFYVRDPPLPTRSFPPYVTSSNFFQSPFAAKKARRKKKKADASLSCQMSTGAKTGQAPSQQSVSHSQQLQQNSAAQVIASSSNSIVAHSLVNQAIFLI